MYCPNTISYNIYFSKREVIHKTKLSSCSDNAIILCDIKYNNSIVKKRNNNKKNK